MSTSDVVILTALPVEQAAVVAALGGVVSRHEHGQTRHERSAAGPGAVVVAPIGGMGNAGSAQAAQRAIDHWHPGRVLLVGIAGGIRSGAEDLQLGDVLVADQVIGYESAKLRPQGPSSRWEVYRPSAELLTIARHLDPRTWRPRITTPRPADPPGRGVPMIHIGPVLSGEKVLADDAAVAELRTSWPKMIGVEMEGLGAALVLYRANAAFLMVKAVSDYADESKNDGWHKYAADAAARFAVAVLRNEPPAVPVVGVRPPLGRMRNWPTAPTAPPPAVRAPAVRAESGIGRKKVEFCRRLGDDWRELADWFEILPHQRATFSLGNEPRHVWEWLDMRGRLPVLPEALRAIDRTDLADLLEPGASDA